jgi:two-component system, OmpR family, phosphate regulon sensor histidine kinase PhoR
MGYRKKIFIAYLVLFIALLFLVIPISRYSVRTVVLSAMREQVEGLIKKIEGAKTQTDLVAALKKQKPSMFFRVSIISDERKVLYDTHVKRLLKEKFSNQFVAYHPEVEQAFCCGCGFSEGDSEILGKRFFYVAHCFNFLDKRYVLRAAFPHDYVQHLTTDIELGFLMFAVSVLSFLGIATWVMLHYFTKPISQIIHAITPYQQGKVTSIGKIEISSKAEEFARLVDTLNSLSSKVQAQIFSLQEERNEKKAILESLVEGVIAVNGNYDITYINQAAINYLHIQELPLKSLHFLEKNSLERSVIFQILEDCQERKKIITKSLKLARDGQDFYLECIAIPHVDKEGAILVIQDISSVYSNMEMRRDFISNASHELKTPITVIHGFTETMMENPDLSKEQVKDVLGKILRNCNRMNAIINDLLRLTSIRHGEEQDLVKMDVDLLVESCVELTKQIYKDAIIEYKSANKGLKVMADPNLLESAFLNLLQNAGKYSAAPAIITIEAKKIEGIVALSVEDKGMGISKADQKMIFQRFYTVNKARSRQLGGAGLGLAIVETIMEKLGGRVTVESKLGKGSKFTLYLKAGN